MARTLEIPLHCNSFTASHPVVLTSTRKTTGKRTKARTGLGIVRERFLLSLVENFPVASRSKFETFFLWKHNLTSRSDNYVISSLWSKIWNCPIIQRRVLHFAAINAKKKNKKTHANDKEY